MNLDSLFSGLRNDLQPDAEAKERVRRTIQNRTTAGDRLFGSVKGEINPPSHLQKTVWNRIAPRIDTPVVDALRQTHNALTPSQQSSETLRERVMRNLKNLDLDRTEERGPVMLKWVASFALVALLVQTSPMLFIASPTAAETEVLLLPTRGEVSISIGGMWQSVHRELVLEPGMMLRTHDGEASIVLRDDGVVRLAENTTVQVHDLSDRLNASEDGSPMVTLYTGKLWVQGLVPAQLPGITIASSYGTIAVNKGSVSIAEDDRVDIEVYDRSARVLRNNEEVYLTAGERTHLLEDHPVFLVKKIPSKWYQYAWADQNLQRDAVHRSGIAQQQHERRIAQAGILPTSKLYPVKRFAELMDVFMTFDSEVRVQKRLQLAETRLNEAAALINEGYEADAALSEYKETLQMIADDYDGGIAEYLVERAIVESTSQYAAVQPGDDSYVITKTVLEASADLPIANNDDHAEGALLLDGLAMLVRAVDDGQSNLVRAVWSDMQPYLLVLENEESAMDPSMYKEAKTLLAFLAESLHVANNRGVEIDPELLSDIAAYLPPPADTSSIALSEEEVMEIVMGIREKIFLYDMTRSRINQFIAEMKALQGHPDQGRILRRLALTLPDGPESFPEKVYKEIVKLRWENVAQGVL